MSEQQHGEAPDPERGRDATRVGDIPPSGWKDVLSRVRRRARDNNLSLASAGVAFYALIATFPGLLSVWGIYGLVFDPGQQTNQLAFLQGQLQPEAMYLLVALIQGLSQADRSHLGFGVAGGALLTLWGASLGVRTLMSALNVAYGEREKRSLLVRLAVALLLTLGAVAVAFCIGLALVGLPVLSQWWRLSPVWHRLIFYGRWPAVGALFWLSLLVFYRYGPSRTAARWSWVSWGGLVATALWLSGSGILAWYVAGSARYHQAYGSVAAIVLVLAWFLLSAFSVVLGAEINAELERQTRRDTTVGNEKPIGERGASAADDLGGSLS